MGAQKPNSGRGGGATGGRTRSPRKDHGQVGSALREAYRATVDEAVPDEMLDLLNKLS
ncbi:MAG TPA: NepR family anti-sigma factor [Sphingomonas sp.]|nr:NepR family anti-sigma factor [Sphingomonas sp.]